MTPDPVMVSRKERREEVRVKSDCERFRKDRGGCGGKRACLRQGIVLGTCKL